jgi:predicted transcriptional regulator
MVRKGSKKPLDQKFRWPNRRMTLGPAEIATVNKLFLQGWLIGDIAQELGATHDQIKRIINDVCRPAWRESLQYDAVVEDAKIAQLERTAWYEYQEHGEFAALRVAQWAIETRARIHGAFRTVIQVDHGHLRVGGKTKEEVLKEVALEFVETVQKIRQEEQSRLN